MSTGGKKKKKIIIPASEPLEGSPVSPPPPQKDTIEDSWHRSLQAIFLLSPNQLHQSIEGVDFLLCVLKCLIM